MAKNDDDDILRDTMTKHRDSCSRKTVREFAKVIDHSDVTLHEFLELHLECNNLHPTDVNSADPFCLVHEVRKDMKGEKFVGRTEIIFSNLNPDFKDPIYLPYLFEEDQTFKFTILDFDTVGGNDQIGEAEVSVRELVQFNYLWRQLRKKQNKTGILKIFTSIIPAITQNTIDFEVESSNIVNKITNPNPYIVIEKKRNVNYIEPESLKEVEKTISIFVKKTDIIKRTTTPSWKLTDIPIYKLFTGEDSFLEFSIFHHKKFGKDTLLSSFEVTYDEILKAEVRNKSKEASLNNEIKKCVSVFEKEKPLDKLEKRARALSSVQIHSLYQHPKATIGDYMNEQFIKLNLHVAIDFTASNGHYKKKHSLHNIEGGAENPYISVMNKTIDFLTHKYCLDNKIAAYGFGAKVNHLLEEASHCFYLDQSHMDFKTPSLAIPEAQLQINEIPYVEGKPGLLQAYQDIIPNIVFSGPTVFSKVIKRVTLEAKKRAEFEMSNFKPSNEYPKLYTVLLIITDGIFCDKENTMDAIVYASFYPISIVIVGVGDADFCDVIKLDGDLRDLVNGKQQKSCRDIVQFVGFENIANNLEILSDSNTSISDLILRAVFRELPEQITEYYKDFDKIRRCLENRYIY